MSFSFWKRNGPGSQLLWPQPPKDRKGALQHRSAMMISEEDEGRPPEPVRQDVADEAAAFEEHRSPFFSNYSRQARDLLNEQEGDDIGSNIIMETQMELEMERASVSDSVDSRAFEYKYRDDTSNDAELNRGMMLNDDSYQQRRQATATSLFRKRFQYNTAVINSESERSIRTTPSVQMSEGSVDSRAFEYRYRGGASSNDLLGTRDPILNDKAYNEHLRGTATSLNQFLQKEEVMSLTGTETRSIIPINNESERSLMTTPSVQVSLLSQDNVSIDSRAFEYRYYRRPSKDALLGTRISTGGPILEDKAYNDHLTGTATSLNQFLKKEEVVSLTGTETRRSVIPIDSESERSLMTTPSVQMILSQDNVSIDSRAFEYRLRNDALLGTINQGGPILNDKAYNEHLHDTATSLNQFLNKEEVVSLTGTEPRSFIPIDSESERSLLTTPSVQMSQDNASIPLSRAGLLNDQMSHGGPILNDKASEGADNSVDPFKSTSRKEVVSLPATEGRSRVVSLDGQSERSLLSTPSMMEQNDTTTHQIDLSGMQQQLQHPTPIPDDKPRSVTQNATKEKVPSTSTSTSTTSATPMELDDELSMTPSLALLQGNEDVSIGRIHLGNFDETVPTKRQEEAKPSQDEERQNDTPVIPICQPTEAEGDQLRETEQPNVIPMEKEDDCSLTPSLVQLQEAEDVSISRIHLGDLDATPQENQGQEEEDTGDDMIVTIFQRTVEEGATSINKADQIHVVTVESDSDDEVSTPSLAQMREEEDVPVAVNWSLLSDLDMRPQQPTAIQQEHDVISPIIQTTKEEEVPSTNKADQINVVTMDSEDEDECSPPPSLAPLQEKEDDIVSFSLINVGDLDATPQQQPTAIKEEESKPCLANTDVKCEAHEAAMLAPLESGTTEIDNTNEHAPAASLAPPEEDTNGATDVDLIDLNVMPDVQNPPIRTQTDEPTSTFSEPVAPLATSVEQASMTGTSMGNPDDKSIVALANRQAAKECQKSIDIFHGGLGLEDALQPFAFNPNETAFDQNGTALPLLNLSCNNSSVDDDGGGNSSSFRKEEKLAEELSTAAPLVDVDINGDNSSDAESTEGGQMSADVWKDECSCSREDDDDLESGTMRTFPLYDVPVDGKETALDVESWDDDKVPSETVVRHKRCCRPLHLSLALLGLGLLGVGAGVYFGGKTSETQSSSSSTCGPANISKQGRFDLIFENVEASKLSEETQELEAFLVRAYNFASGGCEGLYERVLESALMEEAIPLENPFGASSLTRTSWTADVNCNQCPDNEPLFSGEHGGEAERRLQRQNDYDAGDIHLHDASSEGMDMLVRFMDSMNIHLPVLLDATDVKLAAVVTFSTTDAGEIHQVLNAIRQTEGPSSSPSPSPTSDWLATPPLLIGPSSDPDYNTATPPLLLLPDDEEASSPDSNVSIATPPLLLFPPPSTSPTFIPIEVNRTADLLDDLFATASPSFSPTRAPIASPSGSPTHFPSSYPTKSPRPTPEPTPRPPCEILRFVLTDVNASKAIQELNDGDVIRWKKLNKKGITHLGVIAYTRPRSRGIDKVWFFENGVKTLTEYHPAFCLAGGNKFPCHPSTVLETPTESFSIRAECFKNNGKQGLGREVTIKIVGDDDDG